MNVARIALVGSTAFLGLTAIAGGIALLTEVIAPGLELLEGSPFPDYLVPGLSLTGVGALGTVAAVLVGRRAAAGEVLCAMAGVGIVIYEVVEVAVIGPHFLQTLYGVLGVAIVALAAITAGARRPRSPFMTTATRRG